MTDRPVYQEEHAAQPSVARRPNLSPIEGRLHLHRPVDRPFAFPLQSYGGPYIFANCCVSSGSSNRSLQLVAAFSHWSSALTSSVHHRAFSTSNLLCMRSIRPSAKVGVNNEWTKDQSAIGRCVKKVSQFNRNNALLQNQIFL